MRRIVMLGSALDVRGGVSAVVRAYGEQGLLERARAVYLPTHCDGSKAAKALFALRAWLVFLAWLAARRVALLHVHLNSGASFWRKWLFVAPARACGIPYVLHVHCGRFESFFGSAPPSVRGRMRRMLEGAGALVALSPAAARGLRALAPATPVEVVPNPVAIPEWRASLAADPPTVLFLGILSEAKGVYDLLEAWAEVRARFPGARLVLAGTGEGERVRREAERLGIAQGLVLPGWVGAGEKWRLLRAAWVCALPSHHEAMPMALLEAAACGVPAVATRVGGVPSIVEHRRTGLLVAPRAPRELAAALCALLASREERLALGEAARREASARYCPHLVAGRLEALWRRLENRGPASVSRMAEN